MENIRTSLITGASSGIGAALAQALARPGATLHLSGRDRTRLDAVAASCRDRGAAVESKVLDVCDAAAMAQWIGAATQLDLVIANAGISGRSLQGGPENAAQTRAIFEINLGGVLNTVLPAMDLMAQQSSDADGIRGRSSIERVSIRENDDHGLALRYAHEGVAAAGARTVFGDAIHTPIAVGPPARSAKHGLPNV